MGEAARKKEEAFRGRETAKCTFPLLQTMQDVVVSNTYVWVSSGGWARAAAMLIVLLDQRKGEVSLQILEGKQVLLISGISPFMVWSTGSWLFIFLNPVAELQLCSWHECAQQHDLAVTDGSSTAGQWCLSRLFSLYDRQYLCVCV